MGQSPRVAVIAIDGTDAETIARFAAEGRLPSISRAINQARAVEVESLGDLFLTSMWPSIASGVSTANHGIHSPRPLKSGTLDFVVAAEFDVPTPFWETAVQAGFSACIVDVPMCGPPSANAVMDGLRYLEWGAHPPLRPAGSYPPGMVDGIVARHGNHPCAFDDQSVTSPDGLRNVQAQLCDGVRLRGEIVRDLLDAHCPDLLVVTVSEAHIAGHQFLNFDVPEHPHYDPSVAAAFGESPLNKVFEAIDVEVGRILDRLGPDTTVFLVCVGGIRVTYGGSLLLDEVLQRMGLTVDRSPARRNPPFYRNLIPLRLRAAIAQHFPRFVTRRAAARFRASLDWTATRAFALPKTYDGHLRINQRGREPMGIVAAGSERDALLAEVERVIATLRIAGTNEPAAARVVRTQEVFRGRASDELPDLMVVWKDDRRLDAIESPLLGRIENVDHGARPGHTGSGSIFAYGPAITAGSRLGVRDIDIAPTVLALLGIHPPPGLDGVSFADLLRREDAATA